MLQGKGPRATLLKRPAKGDGKLTAANLAGLGGNIEDVDSHGMMPYASAKSHS